MRGCRIPCWLAVQTAGNYRREACPQECFLVLRTTLTGSACHRAIQSCLPPTDSTNCKAPTAMILAGKEWLTSGGGARECQPTNRYSPFFVKPRTLPLAGCSTTISQRLH